MKVLRMKNMKNNPDTERTVNRCVSTVGGLERANINLATGEITYSSDACDESALRDAFAREGIELEDVKK